jgi:hypothetical protein
MVYSFAHINAVLEMKVRNYFVQGRSGWVRLHEKGGKEHAVPCHNQLEAVHSPRRVAIFTFFGLVAHGLGPP